MLSQLSMALGGHIGRGMDETLAAKMATLLAGMRDFMAPDVSYDEQHVAECERILNEHATSIDRSRDAAAALVAVRNTVMKLNALNDRCDGALIETDQREQICEFIIQAGAMRGFNRPDEDVTEEWREW